MLYNLLPQDRPKRLLPHLVNYPGEPRKDIRLRLSLPVSPVTLLAPENGAFLVPGLRIYNLLAIGLEQSLPERLDPLSSILWDRVHTCQRCRSFSGRIFRPRRAEPRITGNYGSGPRCRS